MDAFQETASFLRRRMEEEEEAYDEGSFDPKVFWSVNIFILFLLVASCTWCWCSGGQNMYRSDSRQSDEEYRQAVLQRRQRRLDAKRDTPEQRRNKLLQSFQRQQVSMIVQEADLIERNESAAALADGEVQDADAEAASNGLLVLRGSEREVNSVPNCCAICLGNYEVGEKVVWSSNQGCPHAFHEECMVDWLTKMLDGTPCPCCRADFTDLEKFQRERRITWKAGNAFNPNRINLR